MLVHMTARAYRLPVKLTEHEVASWLWSRLRERFPNALGAMLMPNHPHLVTLADDVDESWRTFKGLLGGLQRSSNPGAAIRWEPIGPPEALADNQKGRRMVRYLALNPCRAGLVDDPLCWTWSTHRDVVGAVDDPWVTSDRLARALDQPVRGFAEEHHKYVSSDPSVRVSGTPPPSAAPRTSLATAPLRSLVHAAASATRSTPADIRRKTPARHRFLQLAANHGWRDVAQLAEICGVTRNAIRRHLRSDAGTTSTAVDLCLGDPRLQRWK